MMEEHKYLQKKKLHRTENRQKGLSLNLVHSRNKSVYIYENVIILLGNFHFRTPRLSLLRSRGSVA